MWVVYTISITNIYISSAICQLVVHTSKYCYPYCPSVAQCSHLVIHAGATYLCNDRYYRYSCVVYLHCGVSGDICQCYQPLYR
jgi:hypothetical protein